MYVVQRKIQEFSRNDSWRGKVIFMSVYVALFIQHTKRMYHNLYLTVVCLSLQYFSTLSHRRQDFRKEVTKSKRCVLIFSTTFI